MQELAKIYADTKNRTLYTHYPKSMNKNAWSMFPQAKVEPEYNYPPSSYEDPFNHKGIQKGVHPALARLIHQQLGVQPQHVKLTSNFRKHIGTDELDDIEMSIALEGIGNQNNKRWYAARGRTPDSFKTVKDMQDFAIKHKLFKKSEEQANQLMQGSFMDRFKSELNNPQPSSNFAADSIQAAIRRETMRDVANISGQQPSPSLAMSSIAAPYVEPDIDVCGGGACNNPVEANVGPATMASIKPAVAVAPTSKSKGTASFFQNFKKKTDVGIPLVGKASPRASFGKNNVRLGFNKQF